MSMVCVQLNKEKVTVTIESKMLKMLRTGEWFYPNLLFEIKRDVFPSRF